MKVVYLRDKKPPGNATAAVVTDEQRSSATAVEKDECARGQTVPADALETIASQSAVINKSRQTASAFQPAAEKTDSIAAASSVQRFFVPISLAAVALFILVNASLGDRLAPLVNRYDYHNHTWTWWTIQHLRAHAGEYKVGVLGSSLTVAAIAECDANHLGKRLDLSAYRDASYLAHQLSAKSGQNVRAINLSAPGQMPSDAYLTLRAALNLGFKPSLLIYGLAPRDFIDGTMTDPSSTESFQYLRRLIDDKDILVNIAGRPISKFWLTLEHNVPLVRYAEDIQLALQSQVQSFFDPLITAAKKDSRLVFTWRDRFWMLPLYHPMEMHPGASYAEITDRSKLDIHYAENLSDYRARYRNPDEKSYQAQLHYLQKIVDLCHDEKIELALMNMPIRQCNVQLLKQGLHARYLSDIALLAAENGVAYYDLCQFDRYAKTDYRDSVHLNGLGGKKFLSDLLTRMNEDERMQVCLTRLGEPDRGVASRGGGPL